MPHDPIIAVGDILREIEFLSSLVEAMTFEEFKSDGAAFRAAAYSIQIVSDAVRHTPDHWLADFPEQPWTAIKATGNKIRHEYFRLDEAILWQIAAEHSQPLTLLPRCLRKSFEACAPGRALWPAGRSA